MPSHGLKIHEYNKYMDFICKNTNEDVEKEKLKSMKLLINIDENLENAWYYRYFLHSEKIVSLVAWILHFKYNFSNLKEKVKRRSDESEISQSRNEDSLDD